MDKSNSYTVLISRFVTFLLLALMGIWGWQQRGLLFNPGQLSAKSKPGVELQGFRSHAEFEKECSRCHQSLETRQAFLCTECHTNIAEQINNQDDVHGKLNDILACEKCHPDHRGRDFDPSQAALAFFDHDITTFRLLRHQVTYDATPLVCSECHISPEFDANNQACEKCHASHDVDFIQQHIADFGKGCLACHDGVDTMARFDHEQTGFSLQGSHLEGSHLEVNCAGCHTNGQFEGTPANCEACHAEPAMHFGLFLESCDVCHSDTGWAPALLENQPFEHATQTGFSLALHQQDYDGSLLGCASCHQTNLNDFNLQTCVNCHGNHDRDFLAQHQNVFGGDCLACHDGIDRYSNFEHENIFPLRGKHAITACDTCHVNHVFQSTPKACSQCHAEPLIHAGWFGLRCQNCHTEEAWAPASMTYHDFPLEHGGADPANCTTCHLDKYTEYTCYGCHDHEKNSVELEHVQIGVSVEELQNCFQCHSDGTVDESKKGSN
jgi:hypothetical protein